MSSAITVLVFSALIGYWYAIHRAAQSPSWGRVYKTDLEIALERFRRDIDAQQAAMRVLLEPSIRRALDQMREFGEALRRPSA